MEPTSEQELKQLLEDGKISQAEYEQLRDAMESKHPSGNQVNRPKLSRKKTKVLAILFTASLVCFLSMLSILINDQILRNKPIVIGFTILSAVITGISALRYWVAYWTYKDTSSYIGANHGTDQ